MARIWTPAEEALARKIVEAVAAGHGELVSGLSVARAVGLRVDRRARRRSLRRVYAVMPLAVAASRLIHPGHVLIVHQRAGGALYTLNASAEVEREVSFVRMKRAYTSLVRAQAELTLARESDEPDAIILCTMVDAAVIALSPRMIDAVRRMSEARP
jgi:hypothetical protein